VSSCFGHAHEFFFSFAEIEVDEANNRIEIALQVTTHDFEKSLVVDGIEQKLSGKENDTVFHEFLEKMVSNGFSISNKGAGLALQLEGYEVLLNGITYFYFSCPLPEKTESLDIEYSLLMDLFADQQNKITVLYRGRKSTYVFLPTKRSQTIILS
jgi:hypothetical protein